jgi:hypothetical protein
MITNSEQQHLDYQEWLAHDPFKRASPELVARIKVYEKMHHKEATQQLLDDFGDALF